MKPASAKQKGSPSVSYTLKKESEERSIRGMRLCSRCRCEFPLSKVNRICPECKSKCSSCEVTLTEENIDKACLKHRRAYRCKECVAKGVREANKKDPLRQKNYDLQRNYGISYVEYQTMLESQGGVCAICKQPPKRLALSVDHKHEKNDKRRSPISKRYSVRGLLCWHCNVAIGKFKDNPDLMESAAKYIRAGFKFKPEDESYGP